MNAADRTCVVIPARYASTRFPGKVLARRTGKYLIQHVYEQAVRARVPAEVIVATDDERVAAAVRSFGGQAVMTAPDCASGSDRVAEVLVQRPEFAFVVNLQGDEPEVDPADIDRLVGLLETNAWADLSTLAVRIDRAEVALDPHVTKVVFAPDGRALYFSRGVIPGLKGRGGVFDPAAGPYYKHLGLYGYRRGALFKFTALPPSPLEKREGLEQLRALENGLAIVVGITEHDSIGVDTPEDYQAFVKRWRDAARGIGLTRSPAARG
jgi:3-deoxy-manno-octulosonate cytidylyltransferase (CMP-KDO synthetase)